jgi:hypothetical protein
MGVEPIYQHKNSIERWNCEGRQHCMSEIIVSFPFLFVYSHMVFIGWLFVGGKIVFVYIATA